MIYFCATRTLGREKEKADLLTEIAADDLMDELLAETDFFDRDELSVDEAEAGIQEMGYAEMDEANLDNNDEECL